MHAFRSWCCCTTAAVSHPLSQFNARCIRAQSQPQAGDVGPMLAHSYARERVSSVWTDVAVAPGHASSAPPHAGLLLSNAEEDAHLARSNLAKELQFFERVKAKLRSRETYQDLLKCLNMFAQEITSRDEMLAMVNDLLGRMPELMARSHRSIAALNVHCTSCCIMKLGLHCKFGFCSVAGCSIAG